jgi:hypothetical protein
LAAGAIVVSVENGRKIFRSEPFCFSLLSVRFRICGSRFRIYGNGREVFPSVSNLVEPVAMGPTRRLIAISHRPDRLIEPDRPCISGHIPIYIHENDIYIHDENDIYIYENDMNIYLTVRTNMNT